MTTVAQVKRVTRPLLKRNPDLALVGRLVVIKPVHHLLRGIFIGRTPDPIVFDPAWIANFLFKPVPSYIAPWAEIWGDRLVATRRVQPDFTKLSVFRARARIMVAQMTLPIHERRYPKSWGEWEANDPTIAAKMCKVIEQEALPMLRGLRSIEDFVAFAADKTRFPRTHLEGNCREAPFVYAAQGDIAAALATCTRLATQRPDAPIVKELLPLLRDGDRPGVAKLLHVWEAAAVKRLKLERYWEPTPFPIEL